jgi:hypothetical protein
MQVNKGVLFGNFGMFEDIDHVGSCLVSIGLRNIHLLGWLFHLRFFFMNDTRCWTRTHAMPLSPLISSERWLARVILGQSLGRSTMLYMQVKIADGIYLTRKNLKCSHVAECMDMMQLKVLGGCV